MQLTYSMPRVLIGIVFSCLASRGDPGGAPMVDGGTKKMAERLDKIMQAADPMENPFMNRERAQLYSQKLAAATAPVQRLNLQTQWAIELLNAGETEAAIQVFDSIAEVYANNADKIPAANQSMMRTYRAVAFLRQAEQDNCLSNHTSQSCLFPIEGTGIHRIQRGSRSAIAVLLDQLKASLEDSRAKWLLNVAYMTLGEYPDKVPTQWRIDPKAFVSAYDITRFPEVAAGLGLDIDDLAGGSVAEDFDGDGYLDLMMSSMALRGQLRLFHNNGDGQFVERTKEAGLVGEVGGLNILQTDYDNDGAPDLLVLRGGWMGRGGNYPLSLLHNKGDGTFADVTEEAGLLRFDPSQTAVWLDYNNDGRLDLFIGYEATQEEGRPCELFRNKGDGTFTECARTVGLNTVGYVKGVASADYNNDGRPDLYVSRRGEPNVLWRNDGPKNGADWHFTDVSAAAGVTEPVMSFPTWFFDYDNDGWEDLLVTGYDLKNLGDVAADYLGLPFDSERARLYHNNRDGTFSNVTKAAGLDHLLHAMGCNYGDLDNDGFLDFYLGTGDPSLATLMPNRMFRNDGKGSFQDVTTSGGFGHLQKGHGVSFADLDNDGDQDIYSVMGGAYAGDHYRNVLFQNPGHGNHWICLKLEGKCSNRPGIGARIKLVIATPDGPRTIHRTVSTGSSFGGNPFRQEIGLGHATAIQALEIFWPATGETLAVKGCRLDTFYRIEEGNPAPKEQSLKSFALATQPANHEQHQGHHH